ncbi:MAG: hypothetical protein LC803_09735 [Acidobacteria bacterium]|nr:hypothetical protein [Acidobacteriota bacterium]
MTLPETERQIVNGDVEAFRTGQYCTRPQSFLLQSLKPKLQALNSDSISALLSLQETVPFDQPYHEQVAYSRRERQAFAAYMEEWCQHILERERERDVWGVHILMSSILRVGDDVRLSISSIKRLSGNADFANLVNFAAALLVDFLSIISNLQRILAQWIAKLVGSQLALHVDPQPDGVIPVAYDIENGRQRTEKELASLDARNREILDRWFQDWYQNYGGLLLDQLSFRAVREPDGQQVSIELRYADQVLDANSDVAGALRAALDPYQNMVLGWPVEQMLQSERIANPAECFRVGKHSALAYPEVERVADEEDPFVAAAIRVQERSLKQALGVNPPPPGEVPYIWPEEANAARIAQKIRNQLRRNPQPFSPMAVHLMRDTQKLHGFINDLAQGRVLRQQTKYILRREGHDYEIGPTDEKLRGLDVFQSVVQQVVSYELSLHGQPIPPPSPNSPYSFDETMKAIETHPLGRMAVNSPHWKMWQDVIQGLMLEHDS